MDLNAFLSSLKDNQPPETSSLLTALWYDNNGDWERAHTIVDGQAGLEAAHIHAYLHRKEGDKWNAGYWYNRAQQPYPTSSLEDEWESLVRLFCF